MLQGIRTPALATFVLAALADVPLRAQEAVRTIQQFQHTAWTDRDGAPADIRALAQTADGYLWVGSKTGLFRFDGRQFTRFTPRGGDSLPDGRVFKLLAARDGSLWIVWTSGAASRLRNGAVTTFGAKQGLAFAQALAEASDGSIVAGTAQGLARFRNQVWENVSRSWNFPGAEARVVHYDRAGTLWVQTEDRVVYLPAGGHQFMDPGEHASGNAFAEAPDGTMWLSEVGRSAHSVRRVGAKIPTTEVQVGAQVVLFDRMGALWVGSAGDGVRRVPVPERIRGRRVPQFGSEAEQFTAKEGLSGNVVYQGLVDREGNIWLATHRGLDRFREGGFTSVAVPHSDRPRFIAATRDGALLSVAMNTLGISRITAQGKTQPLLEEEYFASIVEDTAGVAWAVGTGLARYRAGTMQRVAIPAYLSPLVAVTADHDGGLWVFHPDSGLFRIAHGTITRLSARPRLGHRSRAYLFTDRRGRIWLCQFNRVSLYDGGTVRVFGPTDGAPTGAVLTIHDDINGQVWVGGDGGLSRFDHGKFHPLSSSALPERSISGMVQDDTGDWWITTAVGVLRVSAAELNHAVSDTTHHLQYRVFDQLDGLPGKPSGSSNIARTADGRVWVATGDGLAYIDPRRIPVNHRPPPVRIARVLIDSKEVIADNDLAVAPGIHDFVIEYTALSLTIPERNQFRYMLEGRDTVWHDAGNRRQATYTDLPPKSYRFRVIASNNDGVWNETGATWSFTVLPAWYQTLWFRALMVLLVGAFGASIAVAVQRSRHQREQHALTVRYESTLAERSRIAQELHDTLLQGFTGITIQLRAIQRVLTRRPEEGAAALETALSAADTALRDARNTIWDMRAVELEGRDLPEALEGAVRSVMSGSSVAHKFTVSGTPRALSLLVETTALRIGREAVLNALKHAEAGQVDVHLDYGAEFLSLQIRDDGRGMKPRGPEATATTVTSESRACESARIALVVPSRLRVRRARGRRFGHACPRVRNCYAVTATGKVNVKQLPWPGSLVTLMLPPCASTIPFAIASPRPTPPRDVFLDRQNRSKTCESSSAAMPGPVSQTSNTIIASRRATRSSTCPSFGVNLTAFPPRFENTCNMRSRSAATGGNAVDAFATSTTCFDAASGRRSSMASVMITSTLSGDGVTDSWPASIAATSSRS